MDRQDHEEQLSSLKVSILFFPQFKSKLYIILCIILFGQEKSPPPATLGLLIFLFLKIVHGIGPVEYQLREVTKIRVIIAYIWSKQERDTVTNLRRGIYVVFLTNQCTIWYTQFLPFHTPFETKFFLFSHPKKLYMENWKMVPPTHGQGGGGDGGGIPPCMWSNFM